MLGMGEKAAMRKLEGLRRKYFEFNISVWMTVTCCMSLRVGVSTHLINLTENWEYWGWIISVQTMIVKVRSQLSWHPGLHVCDHNGFIKNIGQPIEECGVEHIVYSYFSDDLFVFYFCKLHHHVPNVVCEQVVFHHELYDVFMVKHKILVVPSIELRCPVLWVFGFVFGVVYDENKVTLINTSSSCLLTTRATSTKNKNMFFGARGCTFHLWFVGDPK